MRAILNGRPGKAALPRRDQVIQSLFNEQNLARYMDLLESAADPEVRDCLRERLVEQEDRFGRSRERLDTVDAFIDRLRTRLRQHEDWVAELASTGADTALSERLRETTAESLRLFEAYRGRLLHAIEHGSP